MNERGGGRRQEWAGAQSGGQSKANVIGEGGDDGGGGSSGGGGKREIGAKLGAKPEGYLDWLLFLKSGTHMVGGGGGRGEARKKTTKYIFVS